MSARRQQREKRGRHHNLVPAPCAHRLCMQYSAQYDNVSRVRRGALKGIRAFACVALVCLIIMSAMILRSGKAPVELSSGFCREVIMFDNENEYGKRRVYLITDKDDIRHLMEIASNRKYTDLNIGYEESYTPVGTKDGDNATDGYLSNSFHAAIIVNTVFGSTLRNYFNYDFISEDDARFIES